MESTPAIMPALREPRGLLGPLARHDAWRLALGVGLPYWIAISAIRIFSFELTVMPEDAGWIVPTLPRTLQHLVTATLAILGYTLALESGWRRPRAVLSQLAVAVLVAGTVRPLLMVLGSPFMPQLPLTLVELLSGYGARLWMSSALDILGVYLLGLVLLIGARSVLALRDEQLEAASLRNRWMQARLQSLRMQMSPHFLFNALNTVSVLIDADPAKARRLVVSISDLFRRSLAAGKQEWTTLAEEVAFARDYLDIQSARYEARLSYRIDLEPAAGEVRVPVMLLQPLVENAVVHGVSDDRDTLAVWLRTDEERRGDRRWLVIEVGNRSTGPTSAGRGSPGIGLSNTQSRLATIYQGQATLTWRKPEPSSFIVTVTLPLEKTVAGSPP